MVKLRRVWHVIIALGNNTRLDNVGRYTLSSPLEIRNNHTMPGLACPHDPWVEHMVGWRQAWDAIISFGQHTWWDEIVRSMPSSPLERTNGRMTWAWHAIFALGQHTRWDDFDVVCHDHNWTTYTVGERWVRHDIIDLRQHTRSDDVGR